MGAWHWPSSERPVTRAAKFEFGNPLERGQRIHGNAFDSRPTHVLIITPEEKTAV
jgi:hypothetical protein